MRSNSLIWGLVIVIVVAIGAYFFLSGRGTSGPTASSTPSAITFYCGGANTMRATFATSSVMLMFPDSSMVTLPQVRSGSGIRYEATSTGSDQLFIGKGDGASYTNSASTTDMRYATCTAANVTAGSYGMKTYQDRSNTFRFSFPTDFSVAGVDPSYGPGWSAPATTSGMVLAKIYVPQSYEPGTNFGDAWFTVGTSADPQSVANCTKTLAGKTATTTVQIGGVTYTKLVFGGAGAGNRYDTTSYRTVKNNQCYAIEYTVHYGVLENYPKGAVQAFDEAKVANALDGIAKSFAFLQ